MTVNKQLVDQYIKLSTKRDHVMELTKRDWADDRMIAVSREQDALWKKMTDEDHMAARDAYRVHQQPAL